MHAGIRGRLTYANVLATIAVSSVLGGVAAAFPASVSAGHPIRSASPASSEPGEVKPEFDPERVPARVQAALGGDVEAAPGGLYRVDVGRGPEVLTHGPDPVTPELSGGRAPRSDPFGHRKLGDEPTDPPACAESLNGDYFQQIIYMHRQGTPNRLDQQLGSDIYEEISQINYALNRDSLASGGTTADYKVLCHQNQMVITSITSTAPRSFTGIVNELRDIGLDRQNVDYTIFYDGNSSSPLCGYASFEADQSLSANNANNLGDAHAIIYRECWDGRAPMHENGHNQGAVQPGAPESTGTGHHCFTAGDVMCYNDGGDLDPGFLTDCANPAPAEEIQRFDCGFDTYFDSAVEPNEPYLDNHWNIGSPLNRFIAFGLGTGNQPPTAVFSFDCDQLSCEFSDTSSDDVGITSREWDFGDGGSSTEASPSHGFTTSGTYNVELAVADAQGASDQVAIPITVTDGTPTKLRNRESVKRSIGALNSFDRYAFRVPRSAHTFTVRTGGELCHFLARQVCTPDIDLYVREGSEPTMDRYDCRPYVFGMRERCVARAGGGNIGGKYQIGVHNYSAAAGTAYTIKASFKK